MDSEKLRELLDGDDELGGVDVNYRKYVEYDDDDETFDPQSFLNDDTEEASSEDKSEKDNVDDRNNKSESHKSVEMDLSVLDEPVEKSHKNLFKSNRFKIICAAAAFGLIALTTLYICISYVFYANRFVPSTVINGFNCSNKTVDAVYSEINTSLEDYTLAISVGGVEFDYISGADIELKCSDYLKDILEDICHNQKKYSWLKGFFIKSDEIYADNGLDLNYDTLDEMLDKSLVFSITPTIKSEDAGIIYNGKEFEIKPAIYGDEIDKSAVRELVIKKIQCLDDSLDIAAEGCYVQPAVTEKDEKLATACGLANDYIEKSITLTVFDSTQILDKSTLNKWVTVNFNADVVANEDEINEYVKLLDDKYSTLNKTRTIRTHYGDGVTVSGGDYGRKLNTDKLADDLSAAVMGFDDAEVKGEFTSTAMGPVGNDIGNSYVEVDLTNQKLWVYKEGKQVVETDIISGKNDGSHNTPTGVYKIKEKQRNAALKRENNHTATYWIPFSGDIGINDASWKTEFGGTTYILEGSNGCIYVPAAAAKAIYNNTVKDMAVICYYHSLIVNPVDTVTEVPQITAPVIDYPRVDESNTEKETHVVEGFTEAEANNDNTDGESSEKSTVAENTTPADNNAAAETAPAQNPAPSDDNIIHEEIIPPAE